MRNPTRGGKQGGLIRNGEDIDIATVKLETTIRTADKVATIKVIKNNPTGEMVHRGTGSQS